VDYHIDIDPKCFQIENSKEQSKLFYRVRSLNSDRRVDPNIGREWSIQALENNESSERQKISYSYNVPFNQIDHVSDKLRVLIAIRADKKEEIHSIEKLIGWPNHQLVASCILDYSIYPPHETRSDTAYCPSAQILGNQNHSCTQAVKFYVIHRAE
jgi:hypothetical protein